MKDHFRAEEGTLRIHQAIARQLGTAILTGVYQPGDLFEGEIEASERLGVSRTAYREAVRMLAAKGLLESRPKAGTRVLPRARWNVLDAEMLGWMSAGEPDPAFIRDLFELRGVIEPAAAELAARRRTDADLAIMAQALDEMEAMGITTVQGREADQRFHQATLAATQNEALVALASSIGAALNSTTRMMLRGSELRIDPMPDHRAVQQAIIRRDTAAARDAMMKLLRSAMSEAEIEIDAHEVSAESTEDATAERAAETPESCAA